MPAPRQLFVHDERLGEVERREGGFDGQIELGELAPRGPQQRLAFAAAAGVEEGFGEVPAAAGALGEQAGAGEAGDALLQGLDGLGRAAEVTEADGVLK